MLPDVLERRVLLSQGALEFGECLLERLDLAFDRLELLDLALLLRLETSERGTFVRGGRLERLEARPRVVDVLGLKGDSVGTKEESVILRRTDNKLWEMGGLTGS
jgi:hypothetical protein